MDTTIKENTHGDFSFLVNASQNKVDLKQVTRIGVYGVTIEEDKILLIRQKFGPYAGMFDFPGGGIEFGESPEQALRREFIEEVGMEFNSLQPIENLTAVIEVQKTTYSEAHLFYQIGLIYRVRDCRIIPGKEGEMECHWVDLKMLTETNSSKLLWKFKSAFVSI